MSITFEDIDGVASNFYLFHTKIISATNKISFLTLAETNLDECNEDLFSIEGFQPPIYQSKLNGKSNYVKDEFIYSESMLLKFRVVIY